ncbi:MAG: prepilin peptidase [Hyphomicrobiales bacterium]
MLHTIGQSLLPVLMIMAALTDLSSFRIPNWITGLIALLFFPMALATHMPLETFGWHLLAGAVLFVAGFILFSVGLFGGGDAKLMAAAGLWFGTSESLPFMVMTVMAGGALAIAVALWSLIMTVAEMQGTDFEGNAILRAARKVRPKLPYGFAFAIGGILAYPHSWWMSAAAGLT